MCKKQTSDVYEMRKDINDIKTKLKLPARDIGEPPAFEDPFAAHDAAMAAWYAAQESGAAVEEEEEQQQEEEEIAPAQPPTPPPPPTTAPPTPTAPSYRHGAELGTK